MSTPTKFDSPNRSVRLRIRPRLRSGASVAHLAHRLDAEAGYILIGVLFLVVLFSIALAIAIPQMAKSIQRDREQETIQRGKQYSRAIRLYYHKFGKYPTSIDDLVNTSGVRYLRKRYVDPVTGKQDWVLIHQGEAKVPLLGLFGVPIGLPAAAGLTAQPGGIGNSGLGPGLGSSSGPDPNSGPGSAQNEPSQAAAATSSAARPSPTLSDGQAASTSQGASTFQDASTSQSAAGTPPSALQTGIVIGQVVGVGIPVDRSSLLSYRKQGNYRRWEFVYDPLQDRLSAANINTRFSPSNLQPGPGNANANPPPPDGEPVLTSSPIPNE